MGSGPFSELGKVGTLIDPEILEYTGGKAEASHASVNLLRLFL